MADQWERCRAASHDLAPTNYRQLRAEVVWDERQKTNVGTPSGCGEKKDSNSTLLFFIVSLPLQVNPNVRCQSSASEALSDGFTSPSHSLIIAVLGEVYMEI